MSTKLTFAMMIIILFLGTMEIILSAIYGHFEYMAIGTLWIGMVMGVSFSE